MSLTFRELFSNPDHYLFRFDGEDALFAAMDRAAYHRSIFFDHRISPASDLMMRVPVGQLLDQPEFVQAKAAPVGWIFHVAYCGSTLLARGLDRIDESLVIREPSPLRQLAVEGARVFAGAPASEPWREGLQLVLMLLGRRYRADGPVVVKANVPVNFVLPEVMGKQPGANAILLHFSIEDYLAAILRSADHRAWLNSVTQEVQPAIEAEVGPIAALDDAERGAALWLAQMRVYARAMERWPQIRSLDGEQLLDAPVETIAAASRYFGVPESGDLGDLLSSYSKDPGTRFDNAARLERRAGLKRDLADEIVRGRAWVERSAASQALPVRLPRPLVGNGMPLIG